MEIKKDALVVIISGHWARNYCIALVTEVKEKVQLRLNRNDAASSRVFCEKEQSFPVAENCTLNDLEKILAMPKIPEIIRNFAIMLRNQQKQNRDLESRVKSLVQALIITQGDLKKHQDDSRKHALGAP